MKRIIFVSLFLSFSFAAVPCLGQLNKGAAVSSDSLRKALPGKVIKQFAGAALKTTAYTKPDSKERKAVLKSTAVINTPNIAVKNILSIARLIKPEMFKQGFTLPGFETLAAKTTTMAGAANLLKELETNIKPAAISNVWLFQRNGWLADLTKIN